MLLLCVVVMFTFLPTASAVNDAGNNTGDTTQKLMKGYYEFRSGGIYSSASGKTNENLFGNILRGKQTSIVADIGKMTSTNFANTEFDGGVYTDGGSLYGLSLDSWYESIYDIYFYMNTGTNIYKFRVPAGNADVIGRSISAIDQYSAMIKDSINIGLMGASFNVYSMIPSKTVPVANILEDAKDSSGKSTGLKKIKAQGSGVKIVYNLKDFYHPIHGKLNPVDMGTTTAQKKKFFESKMPSLLLEHGDSPPMLYFEANDDYVSFLRDIGSKNGLYSKVDSTSVISTDGVKTFKTLYTKKEVEPESRIDGTFSLALPKSFLLDNNGAGTYKLSSTGGYIISNQYSLLLTSSYVFSSSSGVEGKTRLGDFSSYGIDVKGLALMTLSVNSKGEVVPDGTVEKVKLNGETIEKKAKQVGVVLPLWYKEAIQNTSGKGDTILYTGRTVKFSNDFNSKVKLDTPNKDLFSSDTKTQGTNGLLLRRFAFPPNSDATSKASHMALDSKPEKFDVSLAFIGDVKADYRGFLIFRNNKYLADDTDLLDWLKTSEASAKTDVDTDLLLKLITGELGLDEKKELTYEEWLRIKDIRNELDKTFRDTIISVINIVLLFFGYILVIYSIFLMMFYWLDIFNVLVEFSLLNWATGHRLYPISSKDDLDYISYSGNDKVKYVTFWNMLVVMSIGIIIGCLFIYNTPIINFIIWLYFKITGMTGVD